jgi:indole-3-glycerol phosphate synthase
LRALLAATGEAVLDALVEAHDESEVARAVDAGAALVGINNRDLRTFTVDRDLAARLRTGVPADRIVVAESGIRDAADVGRLRAAGVDAMLVGETLMLAPDPAAALKALAA